MHLTIRTDGGARGNPGPAAAGIVIRDDANNTLFTGGFFLGNATNNSAEYRALLHGLDEAKRLGGTQLTCYSDSELLVKQINGQYRVKNSALEILFRQAQHKIRHFDQVCVKHIRREKNTEADALVNQTLDWRENVPATPMADGFEAKAAPTRKSFLQVENLTEKLVFNDSEPYIDCLYQQNDFAVELFCLDQGQHHQIDATAAQNSITILRGSGTLQTSQENHILRTNFWIRLAGPQSFQLVAADKDRLVALLTQLKTHPNSK